MESKWIVRSYSGRTPGTGYFILDRNHNRICQVFQTEKIGNKRKVAYLMAASPELFHALQSILEKGMNRQTVQDALAALELAAGKTPD